MRDVVRQVADPELLRKLVALVEAEVESKLTDSTRAELERGIADAILIYRGSKHSTELASGFSFHEIAEPLDRVIALLEHEANRNAVLVALGAPEWLAIKGRLTVDSTGTPIRAAIPSARTRPSRSTA
jgi:hypothetical protein